MKATFALLVVVATLPLLAIAQPVPGTAYTFPVGVPAYDLTGPQSGGDDYVDLNAEVVHLANGRLTGTATADYSGEEYDLTATGPIVGKVSGGARRIATFGFKAPITGQDFWGRQLTGSYRLSGRAINNNGFTTFDGQARSRACVRGEGCANGSGNLRLIPTASDWSLNLTNLQSSANLITGDAFALMAGNGRTFAYAVRGTFNARSGITTLKLKGIGSADGSTLTLRAGNGFELQRLTGKLLGQMVNYVP